MPRVAAASRQTRPPVSRNLWQASCRSSEKPAASAASVVVQQSCASPCLFALLAVIALRSYRPVRLSFNAPFRAPLSCTRLVYQQPSLCDIGARIRGLRNRSIMPRRPGFRSIADEIVTSEARPASAGMTVNVVTSGSPFDDRLDQHAAWLRFRDRGTEHLFLTEHAHLAPDHRSRAP